MVLGIFLCSRHLWLRHLFTVYEIKFSGDTLFFLTFSQFTLSLLSDSLVINTIWQILQSTGTAEVLAPPAIATAKLGCYTEPSGYEVAVTHMIPSNLFV